jgi:hypothetical protein
VVILTTAFQATGRAKVPASILLVIAVVEPFVLWIAIPRWQAIGAACVFVTASFLALLALAGAYLHAIGPRRAIPATSWLFKYVLANTIGVLIGFVAFGLSDSRILALGVGTLCYFAVAFALRLSHRLHPAQAHPYSR